MLIIPLFGDQPINAAQAERGGFAYRLPLAEATPDAIRARLRALLADGALRERAQAAAAEIRQLKSGAVAPRALERLAARSPQRERARRAPPAPQALEQG
ncbi:hypothetical protein BE15_31940 [Sorangium cellulosum]|uniref:Uncharacterized protein n=2 Tax=Sorangium cellulosum TaxID=56 RepID=A0A150QQ50_SORCE|nr:hypothetical protein BE15_31940 [Sorangium cellulosum]